MALVNTNNDKTILDCKCATNVSYSPKIHQLREEGFTY